MSERQLTWFERRKHERDEETRLRKEEADLKKRRPLEEAHAENRRLMVLLGAALEDREGSLQDNMRALADRYGYVLSRPALKDEHEIACRTATTTQEFLAAYDRYQVYLYGPRRKRGM